MTAEGPIGSGGAAAIFNVQRYSVHDGPGIRTTVFFKGCNMRCVWCENPESIAAEPQSAFHSSRCIACGECARGCPTGALETIGRVAPVEALLEEALRDRNYFDESGGGVTISGGEASVQFEPLRIMLSSLRAREVHTVLQTNGLMPWERLEELMRDVSLFHFDLKGVDPARHSENTGAPNAVILENARRLSATGHPVVFRLPWIPGFNDSRDDLEGMARFLDDIRASIVDILPYHNMGEDKLEALGIGHMKLGIPPLEEGAAHAAALALRSRGREVRVSGETIR
jgi:pyruvate formate lyase activating enzyme